MTIKGLNPDYLAVLIRTLLLTHRKLWATVTSKRAPSDDIQSRIHTDKQMKVDGNRNVLCSSLTFLSHLHIGPVGRRMGEEGFTQLRKKNKYDVHFFFIFFYFFIF